MSGAINITRRERRRVLKSGVVVTQTRWVLNYREPRTGRRRQLFFERQRDAQAKRAEVVIQIVTGSYRADRNREVTIRTVAERWLDDRRDKVKACTVEGYGFGVALIVGPLLIGTPSQRAEFTSTGEEA